MTHETSFFAKIAWAIFPWALVGMIQSRFWDSCNKLFATAQKFLSSSTETAWSYFSKTVAAPPKERETKLPGWIANLHSPKNKNFPAPPSYQEVTRTINRGNSSSSPCPYDQLSVIILKRCPVLRTLIHRIITHCWTNRTIPAVWKRGATVLVYKKGDTADPENFRPITLQPVWYKIFSSIYSQKFNHFLTENNYLQSTIQKGFTTGVDGVTEHTETLAFLMKTAKREQRSICRSEERRVGKECRSRWSPYH